MSWPPIVNPAAPRPSKIKLKPAPRRLWRPFALLAALRKALSVLSPVPRLPLPHVPYRLCLGHGAADRALHRPLGDPEAARVPDRPVRPRRRAAVAPEEDRHAHHGRCADCDCDSAAHGALVRPRQPLRLDYRLFHSRLRSYRLCRRLHQGGPAAQPGPDGARQAVLAGSGRGRRGCCAGDSGTVQALLHAVDGAVHQELAPRSALARVAQHHPPSGLAGVSAVRRSLSSSC